jgi:hypothetical protein
MSLYHSGIGTPWKTWSQINPDEHTEGGWTYRIEEQGLSVHVVRQKVGEPASLSRVFSDEEIPSSLRQRLKQKKDILRRTHQYLPDEM